MNFIRCCPSCNNEIEYNTKYSVTRANKLNSSCRSCATRHTPERIENSRIANSGEKNPMYGNHSQQGEKNGMFGKHHTPESKQKQRVSNAKYWQGRERPTGKDTPMWGRRHSPETRAKQRRSAINKAAIRFINNKFVPSYNPKACLLFEQINVGMGWAGQHAENGGEFQVLGYWVDYYEPNLNIVIEYDEKDHEKASRKEKDAFRQKEITEFLGCEFYRIKE